MAKKSSEKKIKVVLVDDSDLIRTAIAALLEKEARFQVVASVETAFEALSAIQKQKPDIVLTELELRDRSGLSLAQDISEEFPSTKVLFLTTHSHEEYALRGLRIGVQGYLLKKCKSKEFFEAIETVLSGRRHITREISELIVEHLSRDSEEAAFAILSDREFEILNGVATGKSCRELAEKMALNVKTIYTYRSRLFKKLGVKKDTGLLHYALRHNLLIEEQ